ncbi:MAG: lipoate--protein ligase family protein [Nitrospiraceae bacterium]|nr:MAG: lipoate--protein ligase family protein [Nitrospiraceae bacterium]
MSEFLAWRFIDSGQCRASHNMAIDEAVALFVRRGDVPPTLRLYGWDTASLSLGYFQKTDGIDTDYCRQHDIPVVRRPTGGRAVLHDDELTYSFSVRTDHAPFSEDLLTSYCQISRAFMRALEKMHINAYARQEREKGTVLAQSPLCFQASSYGEIRIDQKKLIGSAQKRWPGCLLQQGSIPYRHNHLVLRNIFGEAQTAALGQITVALKEVQPRLSEGMLKHSITASFEEVFAVRLVRAHLTDEEILLAEHLAQKKYSRDHWTLRREDREKACQELVQTSSSPGQKNRQRERPRTRARDNPAQWTTGSARGEKV